MAFGSRGSSQEVPISGTLFFNLEMWGAEHVMDDGGSENLHLGYKHLKCTQLLTLWLSGTWHHVDTTLCHLLITYPILLECMA